MLVMQSRASRDEGTDHLHEEVRVRQVGDRTPLRGSEGGRVCERAAQLLGTHLRGDNPEAGRLSLSGAAACGTPMRVRVQGVKQGLVLVVAGSRAQCIGAL